MLPDKESLFFLMFLFSLTQANSKLCNRKDDFKLIETELGTNPTTTICLRATNHSHHQPIVSYDNTNYTEHTNSSEFYFTVDNSIASRVLYHLHYKNISVLDYRLHHVIIYNLGQEPVVVEVFIQPTDYDGDWSMFLAVYLTTGFFLMAVLTLACTLHEKALCFNQKVRNKQRQIRVHDKKLHYTQVQTKNNGQDTLPLTRQ